MSQPASWATQNRPGPSVLSRLRFHRWMLVLARVLKTRPSRPGRLVMNPSRLPRICPLLKESKPGKQQDPASRPVRVADAEGPQAEDCRPPSQRQRGGWQCVIKADGPGPFDTVHEALRALGVSQEEIDNHKRWHRHDRLPKKFIEKKPKLAALNANLQRS